MLKLLEKNYRQLLRKGEIQVPVPGVLFFLFFDGQNNKIDIDDETNDDDDDIIIIVLWDNIYIN